MAQGDRAPVPARQLQLGNPVADGDRRRPLCARGHGRILGRMPGAGQGDGARDRWPRSLAPPLRQSPAPYVQKPNVQSTRWRCWAPGCVVECHRKPLGRVWSPRSHWPSQQPRPPKPLPGSPVGPPEATVARRRAARSQRSHPTFHRSADPVTFPPNSGVTWEMSSEFRLLSPVLHLRTRTTRAEFSALSGVHESWQYWPVWYGVWPLTSILATGESVST